MGDNGPSIELWQAGEQTFGANGASCRFVHVLGRVTADAGLHSLSCSLNGQWRMPVPVGPSAFRLAQEGDFSIELDRRRLSPGTNKLTILANDRDGRETTLDLHVRDNASSPPSFPFEVDWSSGDSINDVAQVIDGRWAVEDGGVRTKQVAYDRLIALGDVRWRDFEVEVPFVIHGFDESPAAMGWPSMGPALGVKLRWEGHRDWHDIRPARGWFPFGAMPQLRREPGLPADQLRFQIDSSGFVPPLAREPLARTITLGACYVLRASVESREDSSSVYRAKLWAEGEHEPADWDLVAEGRGEELASGAVLLVAHHVDATFGNVRVTQVRA